MGKKQTSVTADEERMSTKEKLIIGCGAILAVLSIICIFYSNQFFGTEQYSFYQNISYVVMVGAGILIYLSSIYNSRKSKINIQVMGLVLIMIAGGKIIAGLFM